MSFVTRFQHDLFISYAHVNNARGWIELLHQNLTDCLAQRLGRREAFSIWIDEEKLRGHNVIGSSIDSACSDSALLLCIMSPAYVASSSCMQEFDGFHESASNHDGVHFEDRSRIVKLMLHDVPLDEQPQFAQDTRGYRFFDSSPQNGWPEQYRPTGMEDPDQRYWQALWQLSGDIADLLNSMMEPAAAKPAPLQSDNQSITSSVSRVDSYSVPPVTTQETRIDSGADRSTTVFLAEVTDDLVDERRLLAQELRHWGARILPERPLPREAPELRKAIEEQLHVATHAVHAVGPLRGGEVFGDSATRSFSEFQFDIARSILDANLGELQQIVWIPSELNEQLVGTAQRHFLQRLHEEPRDGVALEIFNRSLEELKEFLRQRLNVAPPRQTRLEDPLVYIAVHPNDAARDELTTLLDCCRRHQCDAYYSTGSDNSPDRQQRDRAHFGQSDGVLILYGECPADWVMDRAQAVRTAARRRRNNPLRAAVCNGPPPQKKPLPFAFRDVEVVDVRDGVDIDRLAPFFRNLGVNR